MRRHPFSGQRWTRRLRLGGVRCDEVLGGIGAESSATHAREDIFVPSQVIRDPSAQYADGGLRERGASFLPTFTFAAHMRADVQETSPRRSPVSSESRSPVCSAVRRKRDRDGRPGLSDPVPATTPRSPGEPGSQSGRGCVVFAGSPARVGSTRSAQVLPAPRSGRRTDRRKPDVAACALQWPVCFPSRPGTRR